MKKLLDQKSQNQQLPSDDDAAGFRKQLVQNYHCISCDRVVDLTPSGWVYASVILILIISTERLLLEKKYFRQCRQRGGVVRRVVFATAFIAGEMV